MPRPAAHRRGRLLAAAGTGIALVTTALVAPSVAVAAPANPADTCPADGTFPGISTSDPLFHDSGVAVLVGGDYTALPGAKESEGVLAVLGDVRVATGDLLNVGRAGGGSQIVPPAGSDMLVAGGAIDATGSRVDVGHGIVGADGASGGNAVAGGAIEPSTAFELNGGDLYAQEGPDVAASLGALVDTLGTVSAGLAGLDANGTTTFERPRLTLRASAGADLHVFDVTAAQLATATELLFVGTGSAPVVVNVSGTDVDYRVVHTAVDDIANRVDGPASDGIGNTAARTLWNFADATSVDLGLASAPSQLVGSVLVPSADSVVAQRTHTNGRLWVGGDLTFGGEGTNGLEHHNYPWTGTEELDCTPEPQITEPEEPVDPTEPTETPDPTEPTETPEDPSTPLVEEPETTPAPEESVTATPVADEDDTTPSEESTPTTADEEGSGLASTGASVALLATLATLLLGGGAVLLVVAARRRAQG
ncbi:choice-of-anchor A family protein [Cellulosimicrobium marinum]|uniref:choice-of-anchor A family protein n=1 Tax=Cellulosimicrobium marinum TaxID=1638992 RepID=UPI001E657846|nr:choice-of-anchor A family protein [Cellulosimicrobium marinum]MCB7137390.1 choice-of-anchor A family protein [Cellulosimicrobium marinum]